MARWQDNRNFRRGIESNTLIDGGFVVPMSWLWLWQHARCNRNISGVGLVGHVLDAAAYHRCWSARCTLTTGSLLSTQSPK